MAEHPHDRDRAHVTNRDPAHVAGRERAPHTTDRKRSGTNIAAILGALVVAVLLAFWLFSGSGNEAEITETGMTEETVGMGTEGEMDQPAALEEAPVLETETAN